MVLGLSLNGFMMAEELSGTISDSKCGKAHVDASEKSEACVKKCVGAGASPVFISGDKVYKIDQASLDKVQPHLGHKVTINGSVNNDTITVESIRM
jgi:hypothetical protein